jgi:hypothetical protein
MRRTGDERRAEVIRAALMGALVAAAVHSLVIERLHFRHGWMFLGLLWAITGPPPGPETVVTPIASRPHGGHGGAA